MSKALPTILKRVRSLMNDGNLSDLILLEQILMLMMKQLK